MRAASGVPAFIRPDAPYLDRVETWVAVRYAVREFFAQIGWSIIFFYAGLVLFLPLGKLMPADQVIGMLPYFSALMVIWHLNRVRQRLVETGLALPVSPRRFILSRTYDRVLLGTYAIGFPFVAILLTLYNFASLTLLQAIFVYLGCVASALLTLSHMLKPAPWDIPFFCLRSGAYPLFKWAVKKKPMRLLVPFMWLFILLFNMNRVELGFFKSAAGTHPFGEVVYFFINPIGSIWRIESGHFPWVALGLTSVLLAAAVAAYFSIVHTLRQPMEILERSEYEAFQRGLRPATYLGHLGGMGRARDGSGDDAKQSATTGGGDSTLEQLEKKTKTPYMENASPEAVMGRAFPLQTRKLILGIIALVGFMGWLEYQDEGFNWRSATRVMLQTYVIWGVMSCVAFSRPMPFAHCLPGRWTTLLREQLRVSGWELMGAHIAIAAAATVVFRPSWWVFFAYFTLLVEVNLIGLGFKWLMLHESKLRRPAGYFAVSSGVIGLLGVNAVLIFSEKGLGSFEVILMGIVLLVGVYIAAVLLPLGLRQGRLTGWQMNAPALKPSSTNKAQEPLIS